MKKKQSAKDLKSLRLFNTVASVIYVILTIFGAFYTVLTYIFMWTAGWSLNFEPSEQVLQESREKNEEYGELLTSSASDLIDHASILGAQYLIFSTIFAIGMLAAAIMLKKDPTKAIEKITVSLTILFLLLFAQVIVNSIVSTAL